MGSLRSAIEDWVSGELAALSDVDLLSDLAEIEQAVALLEAERAARPIEVETRRAHGSRDG